MPRSDIASNVSSPTFTEFLKVKITVFADNTMLFFSGNTWIILLAILCVLGLGYIIYRLHDRRNYIYKIWLYMVFFLTKRQMMIPLVYTLAIRDGILSKDDLYPLLKIRKECHDTSLKENPKQRLQSELKVSQILYQYFSAVEKNGQVQPGTKFERLMKDLEFIDQKLTELQQVYNAETSAWNKVMNRALIKYFFWLIRLKPLQEFK